MSSKQFSRQILKILFIRGLVFSAFMLFYLFFFQSNMFTYEVLALVVWVAVSYLLARHQKLNQLFRLRLFDIYPDLNGKLPLFHWTQVLIISPLAGLIFTIFLMTKKTGMSQQSTPKILQSSFLGWFFVLGLVFIFPIFSYRTKLPYFITNPTTYFLTLESKDLAAISEIKKMNPLTVDSESIKNEIYRVSSRNHFSTLGRVLATVLILENGSNNKINESSSSDTEKIKRSIGKLQDAINYIDQWQLEPSLLQFNPYHFIFVEPIEVGLIFLVDRTMQILAISKGIEQLHKAIEELLNFIDSKKTSWNDQDQLRNQVLSLKAKFEATPIYKSNLVIHSDWLRQKL